MPQSRAQVRLAHSVVEGKSDILPQSVAQEIVSKMHGRSMSSLPEKAKKKRNPDKKRSMFGRMRSDNDGDES